MKFEKIFPVAMAITAISMLTANVFAAPVLGVDWNKKVITASGIGYAPEGIQTDIQRKTRAETAAIAVAYKNLAEQVEGVQVTGETTVSGMMLVSSVVKTKVDAVIKGAKKISSTETGDGGSKAQKKFPPPKQAMEELKLFCKCRFSEVQIHLQELSLKNLKKNYRSQILWQQLHRQNRLTPRKLLYNSALKLSLQTIRQQSPCKI